MRRSSGTPTLTHWTSGAISGGRSAGLSQFIASLRGLEKGRKVTEGV